jgi:hypothetical protein
MFLAPNVDVLGEITAIWPNNSTFGARLAGCDTLYW